MVSLKSFLHHVTRPQPASTIALSDEERKQIARLVADFGGQDNIDSVDACMTRLRVKVKDLTRVDSQALQDEGALGVIILGQEVHAIFGKQSDALRKLLDERFTGR
ncbi:glucose PTS transporter subunit EIIB [Cronobacter muytjensii]|uniref:PTS sugar transporter n=1 Tax=Cronobacter muytjensii TaxID=413501 RepID=A0A2T7ARJ4_9ENTR|nr:MULTISPECIES: glucose PTS transporter subunit EIIB [Cronobacter]ALB71999.1 PTS sugar transporter [Cronobacter muytjensii ATCC 51329]EGT4338613.1 PTS sugar transporter [Cronobacter muytjensii]EKS1844991.1 PTS transporter subunit EIIB [Cronobacter muytjensii]ELY2497179.1 PTS transporter subunit EIIB [Cronobacter muytjensii]ELY3983715.1 PTS transporter subunit EIIB [Cronobacter muytjensii]